MSGLQNNQTIIYYSAPITEKLLEEPEKTPNHEPTKDQVTEEKTVGETSEETAKVDTE